MNTRSLPFRMGIWVSTVLASALLLFGATVYVGVRRQLTMQLYDSLTKQSKTIGERILGAPDRGGKEYVREEINESFAPHINGRFIRVTRADGMVIYRSENPRDGSFSADQIPPTPGGPAEGYQPRVVDLNGFPFVLQGTLYTDPDGRAFLVETGAPYNLISRELQSIVLSFALGIPVFLVVAILGGRFLVRNSLKPIRAISDQAERISSKNISERLPVVRTGDEIEKLSYSLNRMVDRLDESIQHISRFSADVSHELRTPLTIIRGELEELVGQKGLKPETKATVGDALEEIERLTQIVDQLLTISRLDAGQAGMEKSLLDLGSLARSTAEQMLLLVEESGIAVKYVIEDDVRVLGDSLRLKQVIVNLLDNALKYTPPGGQVRLEVESAGKHARLSVADNGIGIAEEALPHIFERFYRADKARTRSTGGTGLGLSIVQSIVAAHEGSVWVESAVGHGTRVVVELPAAREAVLDLKSERASVARIDPSERAEKRAYSRLQSGTSWS